MCSLVACAARAPLESKALGGNQGDIDVIIFSSTDCPIANAMSPEIERIHQDLKVLGGDLTLVHVWEGRTPVDAQQHASDYGLSMQILVDSKHELVRKFGATVTPEAVVLAYDSSGNHYVVYQGLINNFFDSPGNRRDEPSEHYVREAIVAGKNGEVVSINYRKPIGCLIEQMK
tara:strand:- start:189 stop:710 length:522 start_codon:yes stop_codon:yes gene_type:complete